MIHKFSTFFLTIIVMLFSACADANTDISMPVTSHGQQIGSNSNAFIICLGYEPQSLYPFLANSQAAHDVLQAIYDGPIDTFNGTAVPVILEDLPSLGAGSASFSSVDVRTGDEVINTAGYPESLRTGTRVFPGGCFSSDCAITWDGSAPLQVNQLTATYRLKPGVSWSDGQTLSASDSVYGFQVAADPATPLDRRALDQTLDYQALDEQTIQWVGKPGLVTDAFENYFWMPLPQHAWGEYSPQELLSAEEPNRRPLGWGAYEVAEWVPGELIRLSRNPYYFRASEGLPFYDSLIFRITNPSGDTNISNLKFEREPFKVYGLSIGEFEQEVSLMGCDLISTTVDMHDQLHVFNILTNYFQDPSIKLFPGAESDLELLFFKLTDEPHLTENLLSNIEMRQAVTKCLDRVKVIQEISHGFFLHTNNLVINPLNKGSADFARPSGIDIDFSTIEGRKILDQSGWVEDAKDAQKPRKSKGVKHISDGRELGFNYLVEDIEISIGTAQILKQSLAECGIGINLQIVPSEVFWDADQESSIFREDYDIVQVTWSSNLTNPCPLFQSDQIPTIQNDFTALNFSHFSNTSFDSLCDQYHETNLIIDKQQILADLEEILNAEIPVLPIFGQPKWIVTRNDFCADPNAFISSSNLIKIEEFFYGPDCQ